MIYYGRAFLVSWFKDEWNARKLFSQIVGGEKESRIPAIIQKKYGQETAPLTQLTELMSMSKFVGYWA